MKALPMANEKEEQPCCGEAASSCCGTAAVNEDKRPWVIGTVKAGEGTAPLVSTVLSRADVLGAWKMRWGFGRSGYSVTPGLYGVGAPHEGSPVLVTANYKLTFDMLRRELSGLDVWLLVLDTKGVNVWCAAGKGTFGTEEVIKRVRLAGLASVVSHRTLILPQLGAPGVAAHTVARRTGFAVVYGPVRAADLKAFLAAGMVATPQMRRVTFTAGERLVLTPVELMPAMRWAVLAFGILFMLNGVGLTGFNGADMVAVLGAVAVGAVLTPVLLPWIPGPMFSVKGILLGLLWAGAAITLTGAGVLTAVAYLLLLPAVSAFLALNFTGASTYTSFSGVKKEMVRMVPGILISGALGALLLIADGFLRLHS